MICHFDSLITQVEAQLDKLTRRSRGRDSTLLQTVPGVGKHLGLTILREIGDIERFPSVKDFLSYCRLVKGNKFKAKTVLAIKLARAVYFMLQNKTVFDPERLTLAFKK